MKFTTAAIVQLALLSGSSAFIVSPNTVRGDVVLGMDWGALKESKQMKPLKPAGNAGNSYFDNLGSAPAAAAPVAPAAPVTTAAAPAATTMSAYDLQFAAIAAAAKPAEPAAPAAPVASTPVSAGAASGVTSGNPWGQLAGSQQMKPLKPSGKSANSYFDTMGSAPAATTYAPPAAAAPVAPVAPVASAPVSAGAASGVASGNPWGQLAGSQQMKPLKPSGKSANTYFDTMGTAPPAATTYAPPAAAAPVAAASAPVSAGAASGVASGNPWGQLAGSQQMKPLKPSGKSANSYFDTMPAAPVAAAPVAAASAPVSAGAASGVASGNPWGQLAGSQQMKPLKPTGKSANSYFDTMPAAPVAAAAAPVAATSAPVSAGAASGVTSGNPWGQLAGSQQMKPLKPAGKSANTYFDTMPAAPVTAAPVAAAVAPVAAASAPVSAGAASGVASGNPWGQLAGSQQMKPLKPAGKSGNSFLDTIGSAAAPAAASSTPAAAASSVASGSVWESLAGSQQMKPLKPAGINGNNYFDNLSSPAQVAQADVVVTGLVSEIRALSELVKTEVAENSAVLARISSLESSAADMATRLESALVECSELKGKISKAKEMLIDLASSINA